jgi:dihydrofolate reductase
MPKINLIAAMANNRVIGKNNQMPWHMPADLKHFKSITLNHPVIMGRKTYESIGKALPNRHNLVVTRDRNYQLDDADVVHSIDAALAFCSSDGITSEIMVIGGGTIYEQVLPMADRLYLTFIDLTVEGDAFFPSWEGLGFKEVASEAHSADDKNPHDYRFVTFERASSE